MFALGVASGDPLPDSVILWTRLVTDPQADGGGLPDQPLPVRWEVAADAEFTDVVASGDAVAEPALAHSVHVDASGLEPGTWYWYRFAVGERLSPVGRTRTAPAAGDDPEGCGSPSPPARTSRPGSGPPTSTWPPRTSTSWSTWATTSTRGARPRRGADLRVPRPTDLAGYRRRLAEYKADPALQAAHARAPWVCTWDDHEVRNNYAGDVPDQGDEASTTAGQFHRRRARPTRRTTSTCRCGSTRRTAPT